MDLGIFDHLDRRDAPLDEFYESRLRLLEKYDAAGFSAYSLISSSAPSLMVRTGLSCALEMEPQRVTRANAVIQMRMYCSIPVRRSTL